MIGSISTKNILEVSLKALSIHLLIYLDTYSRENPPACLESTLEDKDHILGSLFFFNTYIFVLLQGVFGLVRVKSESKTRNLVPIYNLRNEGCLLPYVYRRNSTSQRVPFLECDVRSSLKKYWALFYEWM